MPSSARPGPSPASQSITASSSSAAALHTGRLPRLQVLAHWHPAGPCGGGSRFKFQCCWIITGVTGIGLGFKYFSDAVIGQARDSEPGLRLLHPGPARRALRSVRRVVSLSASVTVIVREELQVSPDHRMTRRPASSRSLAVLLPSQRVTVDSVTACPDDRRQQPQSQLLLVVPRVTVPGDGGLGAPRASLSLGDSDHGRHAGSREEAGQK